MLKAVADSLLSLFYPQSCSVCTQSVENSSDGTACRECWERTRIFSDRDLLCAKCGVFLRESDQAAVTFCRRCDDHHYDTARAVGIYENALSASVIRLKHVPTVSKTPRKFLVDCFYHPQFVNTNLIVPVPLSKKRFLERGFNQAGVLARIVAKASGIALDEHSLVRVVHTPMHRVAMDRKARDMTVKNAFAVTRPNVINGRNILLIDDVLTSGSTVSHCARVLKKNGAGSVNVLTLARAV